jgi:hypothetical protein
MAARVASSGTTSIKPAADHDGVLDGKQLQAAGEQNAAVQINLSGKIVGDLQIVDDGVEKFYQQRPAGEEAVTLQRIEHVIFRLMPPFALGFQRRAVMLSSFIFDRARRFPEELS